MNKRKYIIITILVIAGLGVSAYSITKERPSTFIERGIREVVTVLTNIVSDPIYKMVSENGSGRTHYVETGGSSIDAYEARIQELENENEELRNLLKIDESLSSYKKINATVINRNTNYWLDSFTVDKGSRDGVKIGYAVVSNGELIGYVTDVTNSTCKIKLLTNSSFDNKISVKVQVNNKKYVYGLLTSYDKEHQGYVIEGISDYGDIPMSAKVTTTGLGNRFPSGLYIGTVSDVTSDSYDLAKLVYVKPTKTSDNLSYVTILVTGEE